MPDKVRGPMPPDVTPLEPQPLPDALPVRLSSPFAPGPPHPLALRAAEALQAELRAGALAGAQGAEAARGKMFGVLVVADDAGRVGFLRAFSGMLGGTWSVPGFAPPLFDATALAAFWPAGEAELRALDARHLALAQGEEARALRAALAELDARHAAELRALREAHAQARARRKEARAALDGEADAAGRGAADAPAHDAARSDTTAAASGGDAAAREAALHALAQESRLHGAERARLEAAARAEREGLAARLAALEAAAAEVERARTARSRELLPRIWDTYAIPNARGETTPLRALYTPPEVPPGGAGDCAAPKLFAHAFRLGLRPLALAEFWWGAAPEAGGREAGVYYPACRSKCGGVLPFMLQGLDVEPAPPEPAEEDGGALHVVLEDAHLLVVDKPAGLPCTPGRHDPTRDSVLVRLRAREGAEGPPPSFVVELDAEASGLVLLARDAATLAALHRQGVGRGMTFEAWLEGDVAGEAGVVELPVRGKPAVTAWRVVERAGGRTRVLLTPRVLRPQSLRVHAAQGLGAPVVGDSVYGRAGPRLRLRCSGLDFVHPVTGARLALPAGSPSP